jgi:glutathione synthase/RimK-type ligase-like ATP-grasp enzyme
MKIVRRKGYGLALKPEFDTVVVHKWKPISTRDNAVLPWGCVIESPYNNVVNKSEAIKLLSNKPKFRNLLSTSDVRVPLTFYNAKDAMQYLESEKHLRLIGRPRYHFAARNFQVCSDVKDVLKSGREGCVYWQELLPKEREFRIFVAFGRVWAFMEKFVDDMTQPAWNHSKGAHFEIVSKRDWISRVCWMSLESQRLSGIDIAAFDVILSNGKFYMLEGNTAPAITGPYKINRFKQILDWVDNEYDSGKIPEHFPIPDRNTIGYRHYSLFEELLDGD